MERRGPCHEEWAPGKKTHQGLVGDAQEQILGLPFENKRFETALFFEFLDFIQDPEYRDRPLASEILDGQNLWRHIAIGEKSPFAEDLASFIEAFCLKSVTLYLYKVKFILNLSEDLSIKLSASNLLNPNFFISRIFRQGSSTEIRCQALEKNHYSWFRPNSGFGEKILKLSRFLTSLSTTEMMKIFFLSVIKIKAMTLSTLDAESIATLYPIVALDFSLMNFLSTFLNGLIPILKPN